ncbi:MAG TPA: Ig-like domain-containing protein [Allosphingosinicella sp.]|nr:Ig-like domain-containing protein [Allosphingosinicella sp.]
MPINGTPGDDNLIGTGGDDELNGLGGNDFLDGLAGADIMDGGTGNDIFVVDNEGDVIRELIGEGSDLVFARVSYALTAGAHVEVLSTVQHDATTAVSLAGNALAQTLYGNYGANVLDGRGGADVLVGMFGNDVYRIYSQADQVIEAAGQGDDIIFTSASYTLGAGVAVETLSTDFHAGTAAINLVGNEYINTLIGNYGANTLFGGGGGGDVLHGLAGDDIYVVLNGADKVFEAAGHGNDLVYASVSYALLADQEVETLSTSFHAGTGAIHLTGNNLSNTLIGNYGFNILTGLGGGDRMIGLKGNDTYNVYDSRDVVVEAVGDGYDQVEVYTSYTLGAGQEIESLRIADFGGSNAINLTGNEFGQFIGGNSGRNVLDGGLGNDVLNGGARGDVFAFSTAPGPDNIDQIDFFEISEDEILLSSAIFTGIGTGRVALSQIAYGPAATTAEHRIVLDPATGALSYDADGNGAGAAVQFARLTPGERNVADLKIYVEGPNHAPVANPDQNQVDKGQGNGLVAGNVLTNDTDADGHALFISSVQGGSVPIGQPVIGTYGSLTLFFEGSYGYTLDRTDPDTIALGPGMTGIDTFTYEVSDGRGGFSSSTLTVTVIGSANGAPFHDADGNGAGAAMPFAALSMGLALPASELFVIAG